MCVKRFIIRNWLVWLWKLARPKICKVESASWRPWRADGWAPVWCEDLRTRRAHGVAPSKGWLEPQEDLMFQLESGGRRKRNALVQRRKPGRKNSLLLRGRSAFLDSSFTLYWSITSSQTDSASCWTYHLKACHHSFIHLFMHRRLF